MYKNMTQAPDFSLPVMYAETKPVKSCSIDVDR